MSPKLHLRLAERRGLQCIVAGCKRRRKGLSPHCGAHLKAKRRYGDPLGRKIARQHFETERQQVRELFKAHADHAGLLSAERWFQSLIDGARAGDTTVPAYKHIERVARRSTAREMLTEACACWLYIERNPSVVRNLDAVATWALGISTSEKPMMALSGVRSSCDMFARNSLL
jgi:hypothetical protein